MAAASAAHDCCRWAKHTFAVPEDQWATGFGGSDPCQGTLIRIDAQFGTSWRDRTTPSREQFKVCCTYLGMGSICHAGLPRTGPRFPRPHCTALDPTVLHRTAPDPAAQHRTHRTPWTPLPTTTHSPVLLVCTLGLRTRLAAWRHGDAAC